MKLVCRCQKNNNGFVLLEIILALGVGFILVLSFCNIFSFSLEVGKSIDDKDEIIQNGEYAINYITREIKNGDKIISPEKFEGLVRKYPTNLGFVIQTKTKDDKYKYIFYYHSGNKIRRCATKIPRKEYPKHLEFEGHNEIAEHIIDVKNTVVELENNIITLNFSVGDEKNRLINLKSSIFLRCPVDY